MLTMLDMDGDNMVWTSLCLSVSLFLDLSFSLSRFVFQFPSQRGRVAGHIRGVCQGPDVLHYRGEDGPHSLLCTLPPSCLPHCLRALLLAAWLPGS